MVDVRRNRMTKADIVQAGDEATDLILDIRALSDLLVALVTAEADPNRRAIGILGEMIDDRASKVPIPLRAVIDEAIEGAPV